MQDFSKKLAIVLREDVASWQLANTIGHIAAYLGNKISEPFDTGQYFVSKDGINFPRNSQFAIIALRATKGELRDLAVKIRDTKLLWIVYVQEMIDMIDDEDLAKTLNEVPSGELDILGIGLFGSKEKLRELTGKFQLWK